METLFILMLLVFGFAVFTALIGALTKDKAAKNTLYTISAKSVLVGGLCFIIGFGVCISGI